MAYDENLALRIRSILEKLGTEVEEKKMFGGITFLYRGKMTVGIVKDELCARYLSADHHSVLSENGVRPMDFTGKEMKDFVYVNQDSLQNEEDLMRWIAMGLDHAKSKL
ncbi:MAG: TfoX/Sxy family protein [Vicingaceae bacterium]